MLRDKLSPYLSILLLFRATLRHVCGTVPHRFAPYCHCIEAQSSCPLTPRFPMHPACPGHLWDRVWKVRHNRQILPDFLLVNDDASPKCICCGALPRDSFLLPNCRTRPQPLPRFVVFCVCTRICDNCFACVGVVPDLHNQLQIAMDSI